jgi:hypothetical protein
MPTIMLTKVMYLGNISILVDFPNTYFGWYPKYFDGSSIMERC